MVSTIDYDTKDVYNTFLSCAAVAAGWESEVYLKKCLNKPINIFVKSKLENSQSENVKKYVQNAIFKNNLYGKLDIIDLNKDNAAKMAKKLDIEPIYCSKLEKLIYHILRVENNGTYKTFKQTIDGKNAFYYPQKNAIICNFDKFGISAFHEIQHKLNSISKNPAIKILSKIRDPLAIFAPLVISATAMLTNKKDDKEKEGCADFIKNNCGLLTAMSTAPLAIEECIANIGGVKLASEVGVQGPLLQKVKKVNKLSAIAYCAIPIIAGLAAWAGNKIRDFVHSQKNDNL